MACALSSALNETPPPTTTVNHEMIVDDIQWFIEERNRLHGQVLDISIDITTSHSPTFIHYFWEDHDHGKALDIWIKEYHYIIISTSSTSTSTSANPTTTCQPASQPEQNQNQRKGTGYLHIVTPPLNSRRFLPAPFLFPIFSPQPFFCPPSFFFFFFQGSITRAGKTHRYFK